MNRAQAHIQMQEELERLQDELKYKWLDDSMPDAWNGLDYWDPVPKRKTRVTIRLDKDMVSWFRKMGPGYGRRINMILRIYYCGILAGDVKAHPDDRTAPRILNETHRIMDELAEERRSRGR